jgi:hypothetical protein
MADRYRAVVGLSYPAPGSVKAVIAAGGLSKMSEAQREKVVLKHVKAGAFAESLPEKSVKWLLKGGMIKVVGAPQGRR